MDRNRKTLVEGKNSLINNHVGQKRVVLCSVDHGLVKRQEVNVEQRIAALHQPLRICQLGAPASRFRHR